MEHTSKQSWPLWALFAAVGLAGVFFIIGQRISETSSNPPLISVSGIGKEYMVPDIAQLNFGITTGRQSTAERAVAVLAERMKSITDAAKAQGIDEKDIQTQSLWLNPTYDWVDGRQGPAFFEATQNLVVKVRDVSKVGTILTAATKAGANQIGGVSFTVDNPEEIRAQAREEAISKARMQAEALAKQLGVSLGRLHSYNEGYTDGATPPYYRSEGMGGAGGDLTVPSGQQEIQVQVNLSYEIR